MGASIFVKKIIHVANLNFLSHIPSSTFNNNVPYIYFIFIYSVLGGHFVNEHVAGLHTQLFISDAKN